MLSRGNGRAGVGRVPGLVSQITRRELPHLDFNLVGCHSYDQYLLAVNNDDHTKNLTFARRST